MTILIICYFLKGSAFFYYLHDLISANKMWLNEIPKSALKSIEKIIGISLSILVRVGVLKQGNFLRYFLHLVYIYSYHMNFSAMLSLQYSYLVPI